jgi:hypothetical protein
VITPKPKTPVTTRAAVIAFHRLVGSGVR